MRPGCFLVLALCVVALAGCAGARNRVLAPPPAQGYGCFADATGEVRSEPRYYMCVFHMHESSPYWKQSAVSARVDGFIAGIEGGRCRVIEQWEATDAKKHYEHAPFLLVKYIRCTFDGSTP